MSMLEEGLTIASPELNWAVADHRVSTSPDRTTTRSLNLGDDFEVFVDYASVVLPRSLAHGGSL